MCLYVLCVVLLVVRLGGVCVCMCVGMWVCVCLCGGVCYVGLRVLCGGACWGQRRESTCSRHSGHPNTPGASSGSDQAYACHGCLVSALWPARRGNQGHSNMDCPPT